MPMSKLTLRDHVEIIAGDFNQGANVLGEVMMNVVRIYEASIGETVVWEMPMPREDTNHPHQLAGLQSRHTVRSKRARAHVYQIYPEV